MIYHEPQIAHVKHLITHESGLHSHCEITLKVHRYHNHDRAKFHIEKQQMSRNASETQKGHRNDPTKVFLTEIKITAHFPCKATFSSCVMHKVQLLPK